MEYVDVLDFDGTIYDGDATLDFYLFILGRHPKLIKYVPKQILSGVKYCLKKGDLMTFKTQCLCFVRDIDVTEEVEIFWIGHYRKIKKWYEIREKSRDVIISASPRFLLEPICKELDVKSLIASEVNKATGEFISPNCKGEEKVIRFKEQFGDIRINEFYSDSLTDLPLARLAKESYLIKKKEVKVWEL